jgi:hypothetical protein
MYSHFILALALGQTNGVWAVTDNASDQIDWQVSAPNAIYMMI